MKIKKEDFLIQVKYSDLASTTGNPNDLFFGFGSELYLTSIETSNYNLEIIENVKSFISQNNLSLNLHAPIKEIDYSKASDTLLDLRLLYSEVAGICKILNIKNIVTHAEFNYDIDFSIENQYKNAVPVWRTLCNELKVNNITISLENHYEKTPDCLVKLFQELNLPNLKLCIDIGHVNAFGEIDIEKWIEKYPKDSINEVHLADNKGDDDTHLPLGEGNIDFMKFFNILQKKNGNFKFVLEPKVPEDVKKSLLFLKQINFLNEKEKNN